VRLFNAESSALARIPEIFLLSRGNRPRPARVRGARPHQGLWLLTLEDVSARDDAELLRGFEVSIRETDLDPTAPGEFYHYQLIGLEVVDESGVRLGSVREVMATGASDVLILDGAGEPMIPMVDEAIRSIDLGARRIVVRPPRGLLEP
jgi:16S rRNA processing protein RimM